MAITCVSRRNLTLLLGTAVAVGLAPGRRGAAFAAETLKGAGTTFSTLLIQQLIEAYEREPKAVSITYDRLGLEDCLDRFDAGLIDFAAFDVVMSNADIGEISKDSVMIPVTAGMVVLAYNLPGVQGALKLSREVYFGIFSGAIRRWDDPRIRQANPDLDLPQRDIIIVAPEGGGGATAALSANLAAIDPTWRERDYDVGNVVEWPTEAMTARDNEGVAALIKVSEGSIGYLDNAIAKNAGLPVAELQNKTGVFVAPGDAAEASPETALDLDLAVTDPTGAGAYPIVMFSWLLLHRPYSDPSKREAIRDFVGFAISNGQSLAARRGYIPLPDKLVASATRALGSIGE